MEIHQLFKSSSGKKKDDPIEPLVPVSIIDALEFQPLIYGLKGNLIDHNLKLMQSTPNNSAKRLREGEVELALIPSLEYARKKEIWNIIPDICISCSGVIKNRQLFFKKGLKDIKTVAVDSNAEMSWILLKILMKEKFMMNPEFVKMDPDIDKMFSRAEAALLVGDNALRYIPRYKSRLDLNEEWEDLTGLPFVYAFWAGREFTIHDKDVSTIINSFELGKRNIEKISKEYAKSHSEEWPVYHDILTKNTQYIFSDSEQDGLSEYFNYAFFFGFIEYLPDLKFFTK
jgi:chorismate dehydratase